MSDDLRAYTLPEAAERLGVSTRTLQRMAAKGELRLARLGLPLCFHLSNNPFCRL